jgi:hypothetical protein
MTEKIKSRYRWVAFVPRIQYFGLIGPVGLTSLWAPGMVMISIPPCLACWTWLIIRLVTFSPSATRKINVNGRRRDLILEAFAARPPGKLILPFYQPGRLEKAESVTLQFPGEQRCDPPVAAEKNKISRTPDMDNQSIRNFGASQAAAVRFIDPSAAGVDHSPYQKPRVRVPPNADQWAVEGCGRTEPANFVFAQFSFVDKVKDLKPAGRTCVVTEFAWIDEDQTAVDRSIFFSEQAGLVSLAQERR